MAETKRDLRKEFKHLYTASTKSPEEIVVGPLQFLAVDGQGDPAQPGDFQDAIGALYPVAFTLKFGYKKGPEQIDYPVMPLEGLWWADDWSAYRRGDRVEWKWRAMIMVPEFVTPAVVANAVQAVRAKKGDIPQLDKVQLVEFDEGLAMQMVHVGPYATEPETIDKIHAAIGAAGRSLWGSHHEIYLSDPNRTAPEKLKTLIRQPMR